MSTNRNLRDSFGAVKEVYDSARPDYPEQLVDDVLAISHIRPEGRILEIGCGTGIATLQFAKRGCNITGLDISKEMVSVAVKKTAGFPSIDYIISPFENAELPQNHYDLIISAQAFQWIEPSVGYKKAHDVLKDNGHMALFWNFPDYEISILVRKIIDMFTAHCPNFPKDWGKTTSFERALSADGLFERPILKQYFRTMRYKKEEYMNLMRSLSGFRSADEKTRSFMESEISAFWGSDGEVLQMPYVTKLIMAEKRSSI